MLSQLLLIPAIMAAFATSQVGAHQNPLAQSLITEGVQFSTGQTVKLPAPAMIDELDQAAQRTVIGRVADRYPLDQFLRESVVAPHVLKMEPIVNDGGQRTGQRVDLWFVAHGTLAAVRDRKLFERLISLGQTARGPVSDSASLNAQQLAARGLTVSTNVGSEEVCLRFSVPILERVQLSGVNRQVVTCTTGSIMAASIVDPRFVQDGEFSNQWRPLAHGEGGRLEPGASQPYAGSGQYVKVTELVAGDGKPNGALFLEAHLVFHEPLGWFGGANLLGSKLPLALQDNVRNFRRLLRQSLPRKG